MLKQRIYRRENIAKNLIELHKVLLEEWDNIPQSCSASNVHSMGRICSEQLAARVGYTRYQCCENHVLTMYCLASLKQ